MAKYKKRRRRSDTSVDDWLMTYADMITLLLCFFAIFLSISVPKEDQMKTARQRVLEQFASAEALQNVKDIVIIGSAMQNEDAYDSLPSIVGAHHQGEGQDKTGDQLGSGRYEDEQGGRHKPAPEGDRIKVIEMPSAAFFTSGSAVLSPEGQNLLQGIIDKDLKAENLQGYKVTVEGHTDDVPIKTSQFPSNWELSTARAAAVVRFFIERGVDPQRLQASGYADTFPKAPNRDELGNPVPENRAQNRRVIIKLEKIEKAE